jgi:hypothetical protein
MRGKPEGLEAGENPLVFESLSIIMKFESLLYFVFSVLSVAKMMQEEKDEFQYPGKNQGSGDRPK